ncbi:MAG TPA: GNAT family N-acetyltransferase [Candidatus Saccharimonadales bacterium]|nr:GNAT family N-acetyltransferase [Candidatus Saccharimonadales bacterium]
MDNLLAAPDGHRIQPIDLATADDAVMRQLVALTQTLDAETRPEDPPYPDAMIEARFRTSSKLAERTAFVAFAGDHLVGRATFVRNQTGSNDDIREIELAVHPEHRRRGLGRALLAAGLERIAEGDARLVEWFTSSRIPGGEAVSLKAGAKPGLRMRVSQLDLGSLDRALMRSWAATVPTGYRLEWIVDRIPDRLLEQTLEAYRAINRMPLEDLDVQPWKFTEEIVRDWERARRERGQTYWLVVALHEATGEAAGFTDVVFDVRYPHQIHQGGTAVDPKHQGRDLGKCLKATMVNRILAELPEARFIRTENAGTNAPMLAINVGMGFAPAWQETIWQLPLAAAKRYAEALGRLPAPRV